MKAEDTLITEAEVIAMDQSTDHSYARERCAFIAAVEEQLFNECFGWPFYLALLNDRVIYLPTGSATVNNAVTYTVYSRTAIYAAGVHVYHEGQVYEVLQATTGTEAISDRRYFAPAAKFSNAKNQFLWDRYLGKLIAFSVTSTSVMYRLLKDTARGLVKQYDEGMSRPATIGEAMALKREAAIDVERIKRNMDRYIQRNAVAFPGYRSGLDCDEEGRCDGVTMGYVKNLGFNVEQ